MLSPSVFPPSDDTVVNCGRWPAELEEGVTEFGKLLCKCRLRQSCSNFGLYLLLTSAVMPSTIGGQTPLLYLSLHLLLSLYLPLSPSSLFCPAPINVHPRHPGGDTLVDKSKHSQRAL